MSEHLDRLENLENWLRNATDSVIAAKDADSLRWALSRLREAAARDAELARLREENARLREACLEIREQIERGEVYGSYVSQLHILVSDALAEKGA